MIKIKLFLVSLLTALWTYAFPSFAQEWVAINDVSAVSTNGFNPDNLSLIFCEIQTKDFVSKRDGVRHKVLLI